MCVAHDVIANLGVHILIGAGYHHPLETNGRTFLLSPFTSKMVGVFHVSLNIVWCRVKP